MSDLGERLRARGKRLTSQRERVLAAVGRLGHATPDDIVDAVAADGAGPVPASTVYRALDALQELGLVALAVVKRSVPVDVDLLAGGLAAAQTVVVTG